MPKNRPSSRSIANLANLAGLCGLLTFTAQAHASACMFRGEDDSARVVSRSGEVLKPFPDSKSAVDCRRLRVVSGAVTVYVIDAPRGELRSSRITSGHLVAATATDSTIPVPDIFLAIRTVLEGGQRMVTGSSRSADEDYIGASMPSGRIAEPTLDLRIPLSPEPDPNLVAVELIVAGKVVYRQKTPAREIVLPAASFTKGTTVGWRVIYGGKTIEGRVDVVDRARLAELQDAATKRSTVEPDDVARALRIAAALAEEGYRWDAQSIVRSALSR